jgi:hypothetical protein
MHKSITQLSSPPQLLTLTPSDGGSKRATDMQPTGNWRRASGSLGSARGGDSQVTSVVLPDLPPAPTRPRAPRRRRRPSPRLAVLLALAAAYFLVGAVIMVRHGVIMGDSLARVANANYVIASRDPHLSAIGFVWNPLPSLLTIPVLLLRSLWSPLAAYGAAGGVVSAVFMAAAVLELDRAGRELGVGRRARLAVVVLFAVNPIIVFYAGNGMSEAMFCYFLAFTARRFGHWIDHRDVPALAATALGLAGAYLTRYEAVPASMAVVGLVAVASFARERGSWRQRGRIAFADVAVAATPFVAMFVLWAFASWMIVGSPFEQFTSTYGNSVNVEMTDGQSSAVALDVVVRQLLALEPLALVLVVAALVAAVRRRDAWVLSPLAVFGSVVAFGALASLTGATFGWLRFYLALVPMASFVVLYLLSPRRGAGAPLRRPSALAAGAACLALAVALPTTAMAFRSRELAVLEIPLAAIFDTDLRQANPGVHEQYSTERQIAAYLDSLALPEGSVLIDVRFGFPVVVASEAPRTFVIPSDRDFDDHLFDPVGEGIEYLVVMPNAGPGVVDSLNVAHPDLYETGAGFAVLVGEFSNLSPIDPPWRLYRVLDAR